MNSMEGEAAREQHALVYEIRRALPEVNNRLGPWLERMTELLNSRSSLISLLRHHWENRHVSSELRDEEHQLRVSEQQLQLELQREVQDIEAKRQSLPLDSLEQQEDLWDVMQQTPAAQLAPVAQALLDMESTLNSDVLHQREDALATLFDEVDRLLHARMDNLFQRWESRLETLSDISPNFPERQRLQKELEDTRRLHQNNQQALQSVAEIQNLERLIPLMEVVESRITELGSIADRLNISFGQEELEAASREHRDGDRRGREAEDDGEDELRRRASIQSVVMQEANDDEMDVEEHSAESEDEAQVALAERLGEELEGELALRRGRIDVWVERIESSMDAEDNPSINALEERLGRERRRLRELEDALQVGPDEEPDLDDVSTNDIIKMATEILELRQQDARWLEGALHRAQDRQRIIEARRVADQGNAERITSLEQELHHERRNIHRFLQLLDTERAAELNEVLAARPDLEEDIDEAPEVGADQDVRLELAAMSNNELNEMTPERLADLFQDLDITQERLGQLLQIEREQRIMRDIGELLDSWNSADENAAPPSKDAVQALLDQLGNPVEPESLMLKRDNESDYQYEERKMEVAILMAPPVAEGVKKLLPADQSAAFWSQYEAQLGQRAETANAAYQLVKGAGTDDEKAKKQAKDEAELDLKCLKAWGVFCKRLPETDDYNDEINGPEIKGVVNAILEQMPVNADFRGDILKQAKEAVGACKDKVREGVQKLSDIEGFHSSKALRNAPVQLLQKCRSAFYKQTLDKIIHLHGETLTDKQNAESSETSVAFQRDVGKLVKDAGKLAKGTLTVGTMGFETYASMGRQYAIDAANGIVALMDGDIHKAMEHLDGFIRRAEESRARNNQRPLSEENKRFVTEKDLGAALLKRRESIVFLCDYRV